MLPEQAESSFLLLTRKSLLADVRLIHKTEIRPDDHRLRNPGAGAFSSIACDQNRDSTDFHVKLREAKLRSRKIFSFLISSSFENHRLWLRHLGVEIEFNYGVIVSNPMIKYRCYSRELGKLQCMPTYRSVFQFPCHRY